MSQYTTLAAVNGEIMMQDLIAMLDDPDNAQPGLLNTSLMTQIIINASGEIDQSCANLYGTQLPFNPVPASVASMALTITCYRLYRRRETPDEQNKWFDQYKRVRDFLDGVNKGDFHLDDVPFRDFPQVEYTGRSTIFGVASSNFPATSM